MWIIRFSDSQTVFDLERNLFEFKEHCRSRYRHNRESPVCEPIGHVTYQDSHAGCPILAKLGWRTRQHPGPLGTSSEHIDGARHLQKNCHGLSVERGGGEFISTKGLGAVFGKA